MFHENFKHKYLKYTNIFLLKKCEKLLSFLAHLDEVQEELLYYPSVGIGIGGAVGGRIGGGVGVSKMLMFLC